MTNKVSDKGGQIGKFSKVDDGGELVLPIGHYTLINSNHNLKPKIAIYGIGSCIIPIIYDKKQKIVGMSHVLLPTHKNKAIISYPHKYADLSIKYLVNELTQHGAELKNLESIIVGGANIFKNPDCTIGKENIKAVKNELKKLKIKIKREETGGFKGKILKFDTKDFSCVIKTTGNNN